MKTDHEKTREELIDELTTLRRRMADSERQEIYSPESHESIKLAFMLRERKEAFHSIFNNAPDGILFSYPDGRIYIANQKACEILGESEGKICSGGCLALYTNDPRFPEALQKTLDTGKSAGELHFRRKDGTTFPVDFSLSTCTSTNGELRICTIFRDISRRKQAEDALQESEEKYRNVFATENDALFLIERATGNILEVNDAACHLYGYTQDEMLRLRHADMSAEPDKTEQAAQNGPNRISLRYHRKKDGTIFPVDISASFFWVKEKEVILAAIRDITERINTENALRDSETRYRELFDNISSGVAIYEAIDGGNDFIFKDFNQAGEWLDGNNRSELIGKSLLDARPGVRAFGLFDVLKRVWETGRPEHFPVALYQDSRLTGWYKNYVYKLPSGEIVAVFDNLTESKQTEKALVESEEKYRRVFENDLLAICIFDLETHRFLDVNDAHIRLYGYSREELLGGMKCFELSAEIESSRQSVQEIKDMAKTQYIPIRYHKKKDGTVFPVEIIGGPYLFKDRPVMFAMVRDISDRKRMEQDLKKYQEHLEDLIKERTEELESKTVALQELNTALRVLLKQREDDKNDMEERFVVNIRNLVLPYIEQMKKAPLDIRQQTFLNIIAAHLSEIITPMLKNLHHFNLTPQETKVASLVRQGKSTKEIADILGVANGSIDVHRKKIREKLGLKNRKTNLLSYLENLDK